MEKPEQDKTEESQVNDAIIMQAGVDGYLLLSEIVVPIDIVEGLQNDLNELEACVQSAFRIYEDKSRQRAVVGVRNHRKALTKSSDSSFLDCIKAFILAHIGSHNTNMTSVPNLIDSGERLPTLEDTRRLVISSFKKDIEGL